jgi:hypothetical protein
MQASSQGPQEKMDISENDKDRQVRGKIDNESPSSARIDRLINWSPNTSLRVSKDPYLLIHWLRLLQASKGETNRHKTNKHNP